MLSDIFFFYPESGMVKGWDVSVLIWWESDALLVLDVRQTDVSKKRKKIKLIEFISYSVTNEVLFFFVDYIYFTVNILCDICLWEVAELLKQEKSLGW